jgi:RPA family protein
MKKISLLMMAMAISALTFTACEDVPEPYPTPTPTNNGGNNGQGEGTATGDGTLENPFNSVAAAKAAKELGSGNVSEQMYYIKGKVVSIATDKNGNVLNFDQGTYGNASFYISDDGTETGQFYCYRVLYLGNKKWTQGAGDILKVGDEVIVCAKLTLYNTTPETQQNEGFLYSLNGKSEGGGTEGVATGDGSLENPFNSVAATNEAKKLASGAVSDKAYYIKGKVVSIATDKNGNVLNFDQGTYGNASFYISDDGTETGQFYCYRVLYLGNKKWAQGAGDILRVGDEVIVCAKLTMYNTTPETQQNEGYLYSLNGKTEGGGGGDTPAADAKAVTVAEFNAAAESDDVWYKLTGTVKNLKDGDQYGNFDLEDATGTVYVYGLLSEKGGEKKKFQDLVAAKGIKNGSKITIIGTRGSYNDKIEVMNAYFVSIEGGGSGDTQPGGEVKTVTVADFNAAAESNDVWYQLTGTVKNLKDGDQYGNFDLEDATGSVYVYGLLSEKGGEKKKFQDLVAAKGITNGCTLTIIGTRGSYNDKIEVTNAYFVSIEGGDTPGGGGGDTPGGGGTTVTSLTNGDFEAWSGNQPTGWKSASTASSATLAQSTDAHGGSYSVNVNGKEGSNVRLASQEITLSAGTYVFSFYAKATTADASQVRPGYVPVADGKVGSYAYGNYANLSNTSWTQVTHEFTLDAETTVCLVVMNPKKSEYSTGKDVLVDDATLTKK